MKRQSRKSSKSELHIEQIKCKGRSRNSNHAPRAGKELTAGGSRTQTSIADATGNVPSAISRVGSRAVAMELWSALGPQGSALKALSGPSQGSQGAAPLSGCKAKLAAALDG